MAEAPGWSSDQARVRVKDEISEDSEECNSIGHFGCMNSLLARERRTGVGYLSPRQGSRLSASARMACRWGDVLDKSALYGVEQSRVPIHLVECQFIEHVTCMPSSLSRHASPSLRVLACLQLILTPGHFKQDGYSHAAPTLF